MNTPTKTSTRWKHLASTSDVDADGTIHTNMHFMEMTTGHDFTVSLSGNGFADAALFVGALLAAAAAIRKVTGMPQDDNTTLVPSTKAH